MRSGKRRGKTKNCNKLSRLRLLEEVCSALRSSGRPRGRRPPALAEAAWAAGCAWVRRAVGRPVHSWAGRRALRAPSLDSWLRAAGSERRELGEEPGPAAAALQSLAFCAATLPEPFREPRRPRSRSEPLPRESLRLRIGPPVETAHTAVRLGKTQSLRGSLAVASLKEGGSVPAKPYRPGPFTCSR